MTDALVIDCAEQTETRRALTAKEIAQAESDAVARELPEVLANAVVTVDPAALTEAAAAVADATTVEDLRSAVQTALSLLTPDVS